MLAGSPTFLQYRPMVRLEISTPKFSLTASWIARFVGRGFLPASLRTNSFTPTGERWPGFNLGSYCLVGHSLAKLAPFSHFTASASRAPMGISTAPKCRVSNGNVQRKRTTSQQGIQVEVKVVPAPNALERLARAYEAILRAALRAENTPSESTDEHRDPS